VTFTVTSKEGKNTIEWKFEGADPATLEHQGWKQGSTMKIGDSVTVEAYRALDGSMSASARSVRLANGKSLSISDPKEDGGPAPKLVTNK
jgi:hypothetical protein